ncbi:G5 domain-containing protein [Candidatus Daviesbacteria bacterium]|nr:G5 domain-containing protein [Candidatus Daviesbacteria bacterium]
MERYLGIVLIVALTIFVKSFWQPPAVLSSSTSSPTQHIPANQPIVTESSFTEKLQEETEELTKKTVYQDDPETEAGEEKVLEEGKDGKKTKIFKITYDKEGQEYQRELISVETAQAEDKKISRGTKIIWKTLDTPDGQIQYWKKMRVYATHYDSHCPGCDEWTATGMRQGKGVIAVDPKVIPLRSKLYIPSYGMAVAGDTGGAIKGNIIDLGFENAKTAGWSAKFVDIYLL